MEELKPNAANAHPLTPLGFLDRAATVYGEATSIVYNSTTQTWSQTHRRCLQLASSISSFIHLRQVVSVISPNTPAMYELQFAVPMAGAILNNINTRLDPRTLSVLLRHAESKLLFVDCASKSLVLQALASISDPPILVLIPDDDCDDESHGSAFSYAYEDLVARGDPRFEWIRPRSEWDPIVLNYTSGTTSSPKGVVHSHRGIFMMAFDSLIDWSLPKRTVYLWTLPIFHANGWCYPWAVAAVGGTNVCLRRIDASVIYRLIRDHQITHMCGAPVVLNMLCSSQQQKPLSKPVEILTAGAPPPATILFRAETLGFRVSHGYGLTETAGLVVSCAWKTNWNRLPAEERARLKARQGVRTAAFAAIDVVDPQLGRSVKRNGSDVGEVVLRGSSVMLGYLKDAESTQKSIKSDGWFYTGDVAVMHPDGYMEIKDRSKDVIITGGENVSSTEVESVLYRHPSVHEVAVVARPDDFWGESPCAFLSLRQGVEVKPTETAVIEFCRERLPHYMVPKTIVFIDELPKTSTGKIQKFVLRQRAKEMEARRGSRL